MTEFGGKLDAWVDGKWQRPVDGKYFQVLDPATGEKLAEVARCQKADMEKAILVARNAFLGWRAIPSRERGLILRGVAAKIRENEELLASIESSDVGKPLSDAKKDVSKSAEAFEYFSELADKLFGRTVPVSANQLHYTVREPRGVTAHISPWNYPLRLATRSIAPALAAGNTAVLKPAEEAPRTALMLGKLLSEAGVPDGVLNVVPGFGEEAGESLAGHPGIRHLAFTGSVSVGIHVMKMAAGNVVPVTLELGGKSANIVFEDANVDAACDGVLRGIFANAGQVCCAGSRVLLAESVHDRFVRQLVEKVKSIEVGPGLENPQMGPLISDSQRKRVLRYIEDAKAEGATLVCGGGVPDSKSCKQGYFVLPTIFTGVTPDMKIAREEIFGPVLSVLRFSNDEEAIALANDSEFGLVAGVWTKDITRAHSVANALDVGQVYVNDFFNATIGDPFGGNKKSGFGRERGIEALDNYLQTKSICVTL